MRFYLKSNKATPDDNDIFPLSSGSGSSWTDFQVKWSQIKSAITSAISSTFYNKTETDTLLAGKANTNDLATVATSGSYNDLSDTPTIPSEQVQSDYGQTDDTQVDFIKNKPDLGVYADKSALWQDATASGNPVTIKTQSAQAAKSTELTLRPIQDLHGYSKPWVGGSGKNKWSIGNLTTSTQIGVAISLAAGSYTFSATRSRISLNLSAVRFNHADSTSEVVQFTTFTGQNFTLSADVVSINYTIANFQSGDSITKIQIESGSTATSYEPYANICPITGRTQAEIVVKDENDVTQDTVTISFGQTVYGGTLDVETGVLTIDTQIVELDTLNWSASTAPIVFYADDNLGEYIGVGRTIVACDSYQSVDNVSGLGGARSNPNNSICGFSGSGSHRIYIRDDAYSTKEAFVAALDGVYACYKLATPTTATLTAAQVNLIKGLNNVSTDADGISLTYFADGESLTDADNRITAVLGDFAKVEGARASQNYAIGDYLVFNDKFCKASAAIATGEALAIGTNLTQTTIGAELKAILAQL